MMALWMKRWAHLWCRFLGHVWNEVGEWKGGLIYYECARCRAAMERPKA